MVFNSKKLFLFLGEDLKILSNEFIQNMYNNGYILVPLDASAVSIIHQIGLPFTILEDWLGTEVLIEAAEESYNLEKEWFTLVREDFSSNGICWPEFDIYAMRWFWREIITVYKFIEVFNRRSYEKLVSFSNSVQRPSLFYYRSDVHATLFKALLGERFNPIIITNTDHSLKMPSTSCITFNDCSVTNINNKITFALNSGEFHRFLPVIRQLNQNFLEEVTIISIFPHQEKQLNLPNNTSISIVSPKIQTFFDKSIAKQFLNGFNTLKKGKNRRIIKDILQYLQYHFEYYCKHRWPVLNNNLLSWNQLFTKYRPKAVIFSRLWDAESQLPGHVANKMGIPTFSLPHGGFARHDRVIANTDYVLYDSLPMLKILEMTGVPSDNLKPCSQVIGKKEHPTISYKIKTEERNWKLLILTYPVMAWGGFFSSVSPLSQKKAFEMLNPPKSIAEKIAIKIKPHPKDNEVNLEFFSLINSDFIKEICPPKADLSQLIKETDLVVALNCDSVPVKLAVIYEKPVIFFWTSPFYLKKIGPYAYSHLLLPVGTLVHTADELWRTVKYFFEDEKFAQDLHLKAKRFAREYFDISKYPSIGDVVGQALSKKNNKPTKTNIIRIHLEMLIPNYKSIPVLEQEYGYTKMKRSEIMAICRIVKLKQPKIIFEIGTHCARTTIRLAANSQAEIYTLDSVPTDNINNESDIIFQSTPYKDRIHRLYGNSLNYDYSSFYEKVDFIFVDSCHKFHYVLKNSLNAFQMLKSDGVIIWNHYASYAPGVMKALDEISAKFILFHIRNTHLVIFFGQQQRYLDHFERTKQNNFNQQSVQYCSNNKKTNLVAEKTKSWNTVDSARKYIDAMEKAEGHFFNEISNRLFLKYCRSGNSVLDLGCGNGLVSLYLASHGCSVTACDISKPMLDALNENKKELDIKILHGNAYAIPAKDNEFDVVLSRTFLPHFPDWQRILAEMCRCCRYEGRIIFTFLNRDHRELAEKVCTSACEFKTYNDLNLPSNKFLANFSNDELISLCKKLNLKILAIHPFDFFWENAFIGHSLSTENYYKFYESLKEIKNYKEVFDFLVWLEENVIRYLPNFMTYNQFIVLEKLQSLF